MTIDDTANFLDIKRESCRQFWYGEKIPPEGIVYELKEESIKISGSKNALQNMSAKQIVETMNDNGN